MSLERLKQIFADIGTAVAVLCNHPEPTVNSTGQTIGLKMRDAQEALDNVANDLNKVEADMIDDDLNKQEADANEGKTVIDKPTYNPPNRSRK